MAEGRLFTGEQAVELGLADGVGSYEDAILMAARMGGIDGDPDVIKKRRPRPLLERIMGETYTNLARNRQERIALKYIIP